MIKCRICGREFSLITNTHLQLHEITVEDYKKLFPDTKICSKEYIDKQSKRMQAYWESKSGRKQRKTLSKLWKDQNSIYNSHEYRQKLRKSQIRAYKEGRRKPSHKRWHHTEESKEKIRKGMIRRLELGIHNFQTQTNPAKLPGFKKKSRESFLRHEELVKEHAKLLEEQGFRVFPICRGLPRPDIIALKNGKVYAVEVVRRSKPNYEKYLETNPYDDIIWIFERRKRK